jgi:hypothetical protein
MAKRTPLVLAVARLVDVLAVPFTALAAIWLKFLRTMGLQYMPVSKRLLLRIGVMPVRDHYYEPMINPSHLRYELSKPRNLPAIDFNVDEQLSLLDRFTFQEELAKFPLAQENRLEFFYRNASFGSGDAEYLYSIIRLTKPKRIIEIGSGFSTLMARAAVDRNRALDARYGCEHTCIEPYEQPWLEELRLRVIRRRVEICDPNLFAELQAGDILFIDSSHVIRPQGDVVFEYLELLPILRSGVLVHIHDIFTPRDYLDEWVIDEVKLWNEQYLLEAFLSFNKEFRIIGAVNFLKHNYPQAIQKCFPVLGGEMARREPGSFWIAKR